MKERSDGEEPSSALAKTDNADSTRATPNTLHCEPGCAKFRKDKDDPSAANSNKESVLPMRHALTTDTVLLILTKLRKDKELPI